MSIRSMRSAFVLLVSLALLAGSGCYSYNPYGYGGYPDVLSTIPSQTVAPTGTGLPGQPMIPGTLPIGPQATQPNGQWQQAPSVNVIPAPATGAGQPVPNYQDPTDPPPATGVQPMESSALRIPSPATIASSPALTAPATTAPVTVEDAGDVIPAKAEAAGAAGDAAGEFSPPIESTKTRHPLADTATTIKESNYGYDDRQYSWLKGTVEYVKADNSWHIMYDQSPDANDQYGGDLSLIDDPRLEALSDNDVIYIKGAFDAKALDGLGKPRYRIENLSRLDAR